MYVYTYFAKLFSVTAGKDWKPLSNASFGTSGSQ